MGSCAAPSAKGDDKFITTDYLQQCQKGYQPHVLQYMIGNCTIYFVPDCQDNYSLLVRNSSFGRLRLFRYPDDTMFCTFCREDADDSLKSIMTHLWELDAEMTDPVIAMFNHV